MMNFGVVNWLITCGNFVWKNSNFLLLHARLPGYMTSGIRADSGGVQVKEVDLTNRCNQELVQFCREPGEW